MGMQPLYSLTCRSLHTGIQQAQCAPQGTGTQVDHKRELLLQEQVAFDSHCSSTISKASLVSLQELEQLMQKHILKAED